MFLPKDSQRSGEMVGRTSGYAAVWCPEVRLQAIVKRVHTKDVPIALVDDSRRQSVLLSHNEAATREGVEPGMRTVQALARCPDLQIERPLPSAELALGRELLETALCWVPGVEEIEPGWLTLDLSTQEESEWLESARRLRGRLYDRGIEVVVGLGETPSLARIAAMAAREQGEGVWQLEASQRQAFLDRLPLVIGEVSAELEERLQLWGITSLGSFARLSRESVAARLGNEGVELWLRLTGQICRPLRLVSLEELFESHHEFDYEVRDREPLLFVVNRFIDDLIVRVGNTGRAVIAAHLLLTYTDGSCYARRLVLPEPLLDHEALFHLVGGHIEQLDTKAAVEGLRLRFEPSDPVASQRTLFGSGLKNSYQFGETMGRLRKLVGSRCLGSPRRKDSHVPGAFELVPLSSEIEDRRPEPGPPRVGPPFHRLRSGLRATVQFREGIPFRVETRRYEGLVVEARGPWKRGGRWWHEGEQWDRVEWDVELRGWGLFRLVGKDGEWILEGRYG
ncbi:MAG: DNA polymerase Y family protein [Verrucomicrobiales bacterium]|nr:DNA polymerase Y family protein [Verrucomicrobiales bacterium]